MSNLGMTIFRPGCHMVSMGDGISIFPPKGGAAAGNGLLNNLIAYWPGNEVAGNALDLHTNALHLTDTNTVTSNPGLSYPLARQYTAANAEYHTRPGDDALLSAGDTDFTLALCIYMDSKPGSSMIVAGKDQIGATVREYDILWNQATDRYRWIVFDGTNLIGDVSANTFGVPALNTWYLVVAWHNAVANTVSIQINGGVVDVAGTGGVPGDTLAVFQLSMLNVLYRWDGRANPTMFWKSAPGAGGILTAAQRTALWNGGVPLTYAAFTV